MANNDINLFAQLSGFRVLVLANRLGCDSDLARSVHHKLASVLAEMIEDLRKVIIAERNYDDRSEPDYWDYADEFTNDFDALPLLDAAPLFGKDGRAFDLSVRRWYQVMEGYPKRVPVRPADLGDLARLLEDMTADLEISFTLDRFFWTESALEHWVFAEERRAG